MGWDPWRYASGEVEALGVVGVEDEEAAEVEEGDVVERGEEEHHPAQAQQQVGSRHAQGLHWADGAGGGRVPVVNIL